MKTCVIIEDQPPAQRILQKYIADSKVLELKNIFSDVIKANEYLNREPVDLIFLDIHLPKISGIEFLKIYKNNSEIILTTAFAEYALESYDYNVVDYLLKPFSYDRFLQALQKMKDNNNDEYKFIYIKSGYDLIKLDQNDILYIKSDGDYTEVKTVDKVYLSTDTLKQWLEKLNDDFCQVHKSFIANTNKLVKVSGNQVFTSSDDIIPIGRVYKKEFMDKFS